MFLLNCGHGINYGFEVMVKHESPNTPFTILRTRFKDVPETVIYDNSCNLHSYCLNRDPLLFKNTWFLVDRLHWKNHKGCSVGYQLSRYPQYDNVNSQVVEQCNSALKKLKGQLSYMNPATSCGRQSYSSGTKTRLLSRECKVIIKLLHSVYLAL
ncbi:uncharacterized protein LOC144867969 [Branchiostoma floridae x Branchiostoma japonicum]